MRLGLIHVAQETCSFNPEPSTLADFAALGLHEGRAILERCAGIGEVGGFLEVLAGEPAIEPVPILRAFTIAGGALDAAALAWLEERVAAGLAGAGRLDGLALQLHGACAARGEPDVDGRLVALCRTRLGPEIPILLSLDHHANLTRRMVEGASAIVAHRTQPHDLRDTGRAATRLLIRILRERLRPVLAFRKLPLLAHQEQFLTDRPPMRIWFERARAIEARPGILAAATFPVQPWLDVPECGWAVAVTADGDAAPAEAAADELADLAWSLRREFQRRESLPVPEALERAAAAPPGRVALLEIGPALVLASERRGVGGIAPELWRAFAVEPAEARLAILKTASNFQYFRPLVSDLVRVDTPGPATSDLASLPWRHVPRPIFPLDPVDDWRSAAR